MRTDEDRVQPLTLKLKRSASGIQRLTTSSLTPPLHIKPSSTSVFPTTSAIKSTSSATLNNCSPSSVQAARKNVQSTAELVAQISEQLQHYGTIFETSTLVSNGNKDTIKQQLQVHLENEVIPMPALAENGVEFVTKYDSTSTKKRRVKLSDPNQNHSQDIELINGRHQTVFIEDAVQNKKESKKKRGRPKVTDTGIYLNNITDGSVMNEKTATTTNNSQSLTSTPKFNWFEKYPLPNVPTKKPDSSQILSTIIDHPCNSYTLPLNTYNDEKTTEETEKKKILILPYLDIGEPDWLIHGFPERERYLFPDFDSISSFQSLKQKWK